MGEVLDHASCESGAWLGVCFYGFGFERKNRAIKRLSLPIACSESRDSTCT